MRCVSDDHKCSTNALCALFSPAMSRFVLIQEVAVGPAILGGSQLPYTMSYLVPRETIDYSLLAELDATPVFGGLIYAHMHDKALTKLYPLMKGHRVAGEHNRLTLPAGACVVGVYSVFVDPLGDLPFRDDYFAYLDDDVK